jgi:RluA family pseudouridine synthase
MNPRSPNLRTQFIARNVRIVHEDDDVIVVDKPTGLVTADPARATGTGSRDTRPSAREGETLFDYVKKHVKQSAPMRRARRTDDSGKRNSQPGRAFVIHRLDKEASGLLVFAKTPEAFEDLKDQFHEKSAHRIYYALAEGEVGPAGFQGTRESYISEDRGGDQVRTGRGRDGAKQLAITHYRVIGAAYGLSLLQVRLETGRKNQIRIHMQELGHPLVGDRRFGGTQDPITRLGLHAAELGFKHPATGKHVLFESSPPPSFFKAVGMKFSRPTHDAQAPVPPPPPPEPAPASKAAPSTPASPPTTSPREDTSWNQVAEWYDTLLEDKGSDHYEQVILPGAIELLDAKKDMSVLDVACGQGILCRRLATMGARVTGVDAAPKLIEAARARSREITYHVADARDLGALKLSGFDRASCIMALSNFDPLDPALEAIASALKPGGVFVAVITHPCFRVPGESHWGWDDKAKRQFRRTDAYLTPFKRDIQMHPGKAATGKRGGEVSTPTFHRPIGAYVHALSRAGLLITDLREWPSRRAASSGPRAPEENRVRVEIPLFLGIRAVRAGG